MTNGDSPDRVLKSIHQIGVEEFDHVLSDHEELWRHFEVTSHPTLVFLEPDGTYIAVVGGQTMDKIQTLTAELIERSS